VDGAFAYGTRLAWTRFVEAYRNHLRRLVKTRGQWADVHHLHLLCQDQDVFTDVL